MFCFHWPELKRFCCLPSVPYGQATCERAREMRRVRPPWPLSLSPARFLGASFSTFWEGFPAFSGRSSLFGASYTPECSRGTMTRHEVICRYLVTEYAGPDLRMWMNRETNEEKVFSMRDIKRIISELLRALKYLNSAKVPFSIFFVYSKSNFRSFTAISNLTTWPLVAQLEGWPYSVCHECILSLSSITKHFLDFGFARAFDRGNQLTTDPGTW